MSDVVLALLCFAAGISVGHMFGRQAAWREQRQQVEVRPGGVTLRDTLEDR